MTKIDITLPEGIEHYAPELRLFFDLMVRKLHICRDKGFAENCTTSQMLEMLMGEVVELELALDTESQFQTALECVDVANQAWLLALVVLRATRADFENQRAAAQQSTMKETMVAVTEALRNSSPVRARVMPIDIPVGYGNIDRSGLASRPPIPPIAINKMPDTEEGVSPGLEKTPRTPTKHGHDGEKK